VKYLEQFQEYDQEQNRDAVRVGVIFFLSFHARLKRRVFSKPVSFEKN